MEGLKKHQAEIFDLDLPGLGFSADKNEIVKSARKGTNSKLTIDALNLIPHRRYHDIEELLSYFKEALDSISSERVKSTPQQQKQKPN